ncbi:MAG: DUF5668 domain-containing protein [Ignavibacteriales bacterium]|nr:DUF5668 domain-containing protein [Ignavibacteriales bacterium]
MVERKNRIGGRAIIGGIFLLMGVLFLLSNFEMIDFNIPHILFSWQVILIIIGAIIIINSNDVAGYILVAIGVIFLLSKYYFFNAWELWPIALIILGIYILLNVKRKPKNYHSNHFENSRSKGTEINEDILDEMAVFGGGKRYINSKNFQGGKITAIMGGAEIDLSDSQLAPGENVIDILAIMGGVSFYVPRDWKVILKITPLFGGFNDERRRDRNAVYPDDKVLIIKGVVIFGGGEIKEA